MWPPIVLALVALVALIWFGRDMTFYHDEYAMILLRDLSVNGIFSPHNEHLSATLVVLYRTLLGTVGMASYWPYLLVTFALHIAVAGIVYVVVRREAGMGWALGAMAVVLMLGSGGDDILWAFQSGTIGAMAAGMAAVVVAPKRPGAGGHPADGLAGHVRGEHGVRGRDRLPSRADPAARARVAAPAARAVRRVVPAVRDEGGLPSGCTACPRMS